MERLMRIRRAMKFSLLRSSPNSERRHPYRQMRIPGGALRHHTCDVMAIAPALPGPRATMQPIFAMDMATMNAGADLDDASSGCSTLTDLPDEVLALILSHLDKAARGSLFRCCHALRWHSAFSGWCKRTWVFHPAWSQVAHHHGGDTVHALCTWPKPCKLEQVVVSANVSVSEQHYEALGLIEELEQGGHAAQALRDVHTLDMQGISGSSGHMGHVLHMMQALLRACPAAHHILLPHVPAQHLHRLIGPTASHTALRTLNLLSWQPPPTTHNHHHGGPPRPQAIPAALRPLTHLTGLNFTVLGCTGAAGRRTAGAAGGSRAVRAAAGGAAGSSRAARAAAGGAAGAAGSSRAAWMVAGGAAGATGSASGGAGDAAAAAEASAWVGLDLSPLSSLTALTELVLQARAESRCSTVVCAGLAAVARGCSRLVRLELRSRLLMQAEQTPPPPPPFPPQPTPQPFPPQPTPSMLRLAARPAAAPSPDSRMQQLSLSALPRTPLSAAPACTALPLLWPSLREVLIEVSITPAELVSLQLASAPHLEQLSLPQGLDLPACTTPQARRLCMQTLHVAASCLRHCPLPQLKLHQLQGHGTDELPVKVVAALLDLPTTPSDPTTATIPTTGTSATACSTQSATPADETTPVLSALSPLAWRLGQLSVSGSMLWEPGAAAAVLQVLPALRRLTVAAAGVDCVTALAAAAAQLRQLERLELCVNGDSSSGGSGGGSSQRVQDALLRLCRALHQQGGGGEAGVGERAPLLLLLVGCGREGAAAVCGCQAAWEQEGVLGASVAPSSLILRVDELPDL